MLVVASKRRWGAAIASWVGLFFVMILVSYLYNEIRDSVLSESLGREFHSRFKVTPWWAQIGFYAGCFFTGKKFLSKGSEKENEKNSL
jgi:hypothetical protein